MHWRHEGLPCFVMGVYHRDYMRPDYQGGSKPSGPRSWSVVTWLIAINVAVYAFQWFLFRDSSLIMGSEGKLMPRGGLSWEALEAGNVWTLITYMFVHGSMWHLIFNMFVLHFAGRNVLEMLGRRHFLIIYFGGGLLGAMAQISFGSLMGNESYLIGASAGVVASLIAFAALAPQLEVYLLVFFVIPVRMKMKTVAKVVVGLDLAMMLVESFGWGGFGIGNLAHLGGALFGWLYVSRGLSGSQARKKTGGQADRWVNQFGGNQVMDAEVTESTTEKKSWFKTSKPKPYISAGVDEILEKISEHGMQSLTDEERKILEKSSEKLAEMTNRKGRDS